MKKLIPLLFFILLFAGVLPFAAFAEDLGSGNIDSGGGGMGSGTSSDFWSPGNDGVRITVVDANTGAAVSGSKDFSNRDQPESLAHFGEVSKLRYLSGKALTLASGVSYQCYKPAYAMPIIVSSGGRNNIDAIKQYFCSEYAAKMVADSVGMNYEDLISGEYKLFVEPIAYFTYNNQQYCMTATEAALYDQLASGGLRAKMVSLTHQNLPLAMFLEYPDLGLPAFNGSANGRQTNETIISSLGMGIVSYNDAPFDPPEPGDADAEYRVNTEVVTSVTLNTFDEINPDSPATVTFYINGMTYTVNSIVIPEGGSQLVWVKWNTPAAEQTMTITLSANKGYLSANMITAKIVDLSKNPPPDPKATDRNDSFAISPLPSKAQITSASWSVWWARWHPNWVWIPVWEWVSNWVTHGGSYEYIDADGNVQTESYSYTVDEGWWEDHGYWEDQGWYDFFTDDYTANLTASSVISPDAKVPTAVGKQIKSGYGINNKVTSSFTTDAPASHVTGAQTAVSWFPEFKYNTYWRLLDLLIGGYSSRLEFKKNTYSTYNQRVHFVPVWFPDGTYTVYTWALDAWTPAGMLSMNLNDYVAIRGNMFDDWYTNRE